MKKHIPRVLLLDKVNPLCRQELDKAGYRCRQEDSLSRKELQKCLKDYTAVAIRGATKLDQELIQAGAKGRLRLIVRVGAGVNNIDLDAATHNGVIVENTPGTNANAVIELTIAALLAMARNLVPANVSMKEGRWEKKKFAGTELGGKTLGVIGLGAIGRGVAKIAHSLGMKTIGYDPMLAPEKAQEIGVNLVDLAQLYKKSDYISLHASLNESSRKMLDRSAFEMMKPGVCIANCARAQLVESEALLEALNAEKVKLYFTDVYYQEPPEATDPLVKHPSVLLTPHVGGSTAESSIEGARRATNQILQFLADGTAVNSVNYSPGDPELRNWEILTEKLGKFIFQYSRGKGAPNEISVEYRGDFENRNVDRVTGYFLYGFMSNLVKTVNIVNARHLADEEGIKVRQIKTRAEEQSILATIRIGKTKTTIEGAAIGDRVILSELDGYSIDLPLTENHFLVSRHSNVPGVIGIIGTVLGDHKINIEKIALRDIPKKPALAVISTSRPIPDAVIDEIAKMVVRKKGKAELSRIVL
jgi:D-3-phosphoglycerate dehydrogenase